MDPKSEKTHERLSLYILIITRLLYAQKWKSIEIPTVEEWIIKMSELMEMAKRREKNIFKRMEIFYKHFAKRRKQ